MVNGKANSSANILLYSASRVYSVNSVYSVFYSVYSVIYSVIIINSANTLNTVFYSVHIVVYSDLFKLNYSVILLELNSFKSSYSVFELVSGTNGMLLDIMSWSTLRNVINSS